MKCISTLFGVFFLCFFVQSTNRLIAAQVGTCSPDSFKTQREQSSENVSDLLKDVDPVTRWSELPQDLRSSLQKLSNSELEYQRSQWSNSALTAKERVLLECPTSEMQTAMDDFYRVIYRTVVPDAFSLAQLENPDFVNILKRSYLGTLAARRIFLTNVPFNRTDVDWDGVSPISSGRIPDFTVYSDIKKYNGAVVESLRRLSDQALTDVELNLKNSVLYEARALSVGAFSSNSHGGSDFESPCEVVSAKNDALQRKKYGADLGIALNELNAAYLNNIPLRWLDRGTFNSAVNLIFCNSEAGIKIPPAENSDTKSFEVMASMLKRWWIERTASNPLSEQKCTIFSKADRQSIWEGFSADQQFNNSGDTSLESYGERLKTFSDGKLSQYRSMAIEAIEIIFQNEKVLDQNQKKRIIAAINEESTFGPWFGKVHAILDSVQGTTNGNAAQLWNNSIADRVQVIGGNYQPNEAVRQNDAKAIIDMADEIKFWLASRYSNYPIPINDILPNIQIHIETISSNGTKVETGEIYIGVGQARSKAEYYSGLIHEFRHAISYYRASNVPAGGNAVIDNGLSREGAAMASEELLLPIFLKEKLRDKLTIVLYRLSFAIRDARIIGTTAATLERYFRLKCSEADELDTIEYAKAIAVRHGLSASLAETASLRSHGGTDYLQYIWGELQMLHELELLQRKVFPNRDKHLDPYVLFLCGLNTPKFDIAYADELKKCLMH